MQSRPVVQVKCPEDRQVLQVHKKLIAMTKQNKNTQHNQGGGGGGGVKCTVFGVGGTIMRVSHITFPTISLALFSPLVLLLVQPSLLRR